MRFPDWELLKLMTEKTRIIKVLRDELNRWEALLAGLTETQVTAPNLDATWAIKDVMAHLWAWQLRTIARVEAAVENHEPVFPDWPKNLDPEVRGQPHQLNAWLYESNRDKPWSQVYGEWKANFLRLLELAEAVPEEDLMDPARYAWLDDMSLAVILQASQEHHAEHYEWLTRHLKQG
jgi:hypothetical protein